MSEKKSFHKEKEEDEEDVAGELKPELAGYEGNGIHLNSVLVEDLPPSEVDRRFKIAEEFLASGIPISKLIDNRVIAEPTFVVLFEFYNNGKRKDPNNYKEKIKKYFEELNKYL